VPVPSNVTLKSAIDWEGVAEAWATPAPVPLFAEAAAPGVLEKASAMIINVPALRMTLIRHPGDVTLRNRVSTQYQDKTADGANAHKA
jgi:hypothetical protein